MNKILLDTNAYSNFLKGTDSVLKALDQGKVVYMSVFVIAELYYGFKGGRKEIWNKELLNNFLKKIPVQIINATSETSEIFADIKYKLKKTGKPIPINDVWIASHVIETGSVLITFDEHFQNIPGLRIWDYINFS